MIDKRAVNFHVFIFSPQLKLELVDMIDIRLHNQCGWRDS